MKKRLVFIVFFAILASGVFVFIANEYIKRLERNAIKTYMQSIRNELREYDIDMMVSNIQCEGFLKHTCKISDARIYKDIEIKLENIHISIKNISYKNIGVLISIDRISHNHYSPYLALLPHRFQYTLDMHKADSKLGFVMLERSVYLDFDDFNINADLNILLKESKFRDRSIFFILKEWFDNTTPSFYEYSLDTISMKLQSKDKNAKKDELSNILKILTKKRLSNNKLVLKFFDKWIDNAYKIVKGKANETTLDIARKNQDISFFNLLDDEAATKKGLEIMEIINSINETYAINIEAK